MSREFEVISKYFHSSAHAHLTQGIGDDCALITLPDNTDCAISTDTYAEGTHFLKDTPPYYVGYKALAVNVSDLAACGATPQFASLALSLPTLDESWLKLFCEGFYAVLQHHHMSLIGGDLTRGPLSITCTVHGFVDKGTALLRSRARAGDYIGVTGTTGLAALGLAMLQGKYPAHARALDRFNQPTPRVSTALLLKNKATSCIDISDGLYQDLSHILEKSKLGAKVYAHQLDLKPLLDCGLSETKALTMALTGGEDYELCFTYPREQKIILDMPWRCIGETTTDLNYEIWHHAERFYLNNDKTYQHF